MRYVFDPVKKNRHVLVALRDVILISQPDFAELVGVSASTIQSIELNNGRLKLSAKLAERISRETAVNVDWLLENDPKAPPVANNGEPYSRRHYVERQALLRSPKTDPEDLEDMQKNFLAGVMNLRDLFVSAQRTGRFGLMLYQLNEAMRAINSEFLCEFKYDLSTETSPDMNFRFDEGMEKFNEPFIEAVCTIVRPLAWQFTLAAALKTGNNNVTMRGLYGRTLKMHLTRKDLEGCTRLRGKGEPPATK